MVVLQFLAPMCIRKATLARLVIQKLFIMKGRKMQRAKIGNGNRQEIERAREEEKKKTTATASLSRR